MPDADTILLYEDLEREGFKYSKAHLRRLEAAGRFPRRVPTGARRHGWLACEIAEHRRKCIAARDQGGAK